MTPINDNQENDRQAARMILIILGAFILSILLQTRCTAQTKAKIDTVMCHIECIQKIVESQTEKGSIRYHAIYVDRKNGIEDIISISKSVINYIQQCKLYHLTPSLGIRLRNGNIQSIIKIKPKYYAVKKR